MPPEQPLPVAAKRILRRWIEKGAKWGASPINAFRNTTQARAGYDWWSLQPIMRAEVPIHDLFPAREIPKVQELASRELLATMNAHHLRDRGTNDLLESRIRSYQLADRMQSAVPQVANLEAESQLIHDMYRVGREPTRESGRSCLLARKLLEHGVRFVQLIADSAFGSPRINWDGHEDMVKNHGRVLHDIIS